jgi:hypothetical protein
VVPHSLVSEIVEAPTPDITLKLLFPDPPVVLTEPGSKLGKLIFVECLHRP